MTLRRWIADEYSADSAALTGANAQHLAKALRARVGQEFAIACGKEVHRGQITSVTAERVEFKLGEALTTADAAMEVTLLMAIFKFDRMEWAIEKATELGVARILPVVARRTDAHLASAAGKRVERWRRIAKEAAQQSRRAEVPDIAAPEKLKDALVRAGSHGVRVVLSEAERSKQLPSALGETGSALIAVGPEGGWTHDELQAFRHAGWHEVTLGPNILRAETAAIAALAITFSTAQR
jgi:16S rRNA (uracil1498-N3)-methyltransferase